MIKLLSVITFSVFAAIYIDKAELFFCPDGFVPNGTSCYWIEHNRTVTWQQASTSCVQIDTQLPTIETAEENDFLLNAAPLVYGNDYWIGFKRDPSTNVWSWADGSTSTYNNWDPGEPDGDGDCGRLTGVHEGKWRDRHCTNFYNPYICERLKECDYVPEVNEAVPHQNLSRTVVTTVTNYTCNIGWIFPGDVLTKISTCLIGGTWDPLPPCQPVQCPPVPVVGNATANSTSVGYLDAVSYSCNLGYWFSREEYLMSKEIFCQLDATWNAVVPDCTPVVCAVPIAPYNATWTNNDTHVGATVNYTCDFSYDFPDEDLWKVFTCPQNGVWLDQHGNTVTNCSKVTCPSPMINNSRSNTELREYDTTVTYTCIAGHRYNDSATIKSHKCLINHHWNKFIPICEPVHCPEPVNITYGSMSTTNTKYLTVINYTCTDGYLFPDASQWRLVWCTEHATWSTLIPNCKLASEIPKVPLDVVHEAEEAQGAIGIGALGIAMMLFVLISMVLLDLITIQRHYQVLRDNILNSCCWPSGDKDPDDPETGDRAKILETDEIDDKEFNFGSKTSVKSKRSDSKMSISESQFLGSKASLKSNKVAPTIPTDDSIDGQEKETTFEKDPEMKAIDLDEELSKFLSGDIDFADDNNTDVTNENNASEKEDQKGKVKGKGKGVGKKTGK